MILPAMVINFLRPLGSVFPEGDSRLWKNRDSLFRSPLRTTPVEAEKHGTPGSEGR